MVQLHGSASWFSPLKIFPLGQVKAAPKTRPKTEETAASQVEPVTWEVKAKEQLQDLLAAAAAARTMSIKLGGIEYANELSAKLKDHANLLETKYQSLTQLVKDKSPEKILKKFVESCVEDLTFGNKAQACKPVWCKGVTKTCNLFHPKIQKRLQ